MKERKNRYGILLLAGEGNRAKTESGLQKQFVELNGKEIFLYPLETMLASNLFTKIILVCNEKRLSNVNEIITNKEKKFLSIIECIKGGKTRNESVFNALRCLYDNDVEDSIVFIHDAARACLPIEVLMSLDAYSEEYDAITPIYPVSDSLMKNDAYIDRESVMSVQTPQVFKIQKLLKIYTDNMFIDNSTDDFGKAQKANLKCLTIKGSPFLMKITYPEDINMMKKLLQ